MQLNNALSRAHVVHIKGQNFNEQVETNNNLLELDSLKDGASFTICITKPDNDRMSPLDCAGVETDKKWSEKTWIAMNKKWTFIGAVIGLVVSTLIALTVLTYCIVRQKPELIKGNKRVVVVKSRHEEDKMAATYFRTVINSEFGAASASYLTPKSLISYYAKGVGHAVYDYPKVYVLPSGIYDAKSRVRDDCHYDDIENIYTECI